MEIIRKRINLEELRSHSFGLAPYIPINESWPNSGTFKTADGGNGNWGGIICDCDDFNDYGKSTAAVLQKYYRVVKVLSGGIRLKKVVKNNTKYYTTKFDSEGVRRKVFIPYDENMFRDQGKGLFYESAQTVSDQYIRLVTAEDYEAFNTLGGFSLIRRVESGLFGLITIPTSITGSKVPDQFYISQIPVWLGWFRANESRVKSTPPDCCILDEWNERGGNAMYKFLRENSTLFDNELARWQARLDSGKLHTPTIRIPVLLTQTYEDNGTLTVDDSEDVPFKGSLGGSEQTFDTDEIRTESRLKELRSRQKVFSDDGQLLPFIWTDNSKTTTDVPYKVGELFNVTPKSPNDTINYVADYISKITVNDDTITFEYVFGGAIKHLYGDIYECLGTGGVKYLESYPYNVAEIELCGQDIEYKEIDFNNKTVTIYNKDFELYREANLSSIVGIKTSDVWNVTEATDNPVYKKEYLNHISEEPKIDVEIEINRGGASAFENHFKLSECNTMEDLKNYGNNFFNLED